MIGMWFSLIDGLDGILVPTHYLGMNYLVLNMMDSHVLVATVCLINVS